MIRYYYKAQITMKSLSAVCERNI